MLNHWAQWNSEKYKLDENLYKDKKGRAILVDDIITTGLHFKVFKRFLQPAFPRAEIEG
jgi:hypoxanthine-guanine phosphoribosyltransferase